MENVKQISITEFREKGYAQELNRRFLHPLGLALDIITDDDGDEHINGIWDNREDPEGFYFGFNDMTDTQLKPFKKRYKIVSEEIDKHVEHRMEMFDTGSPVEPIPSKPKDF